METRIPAAGDQRVTRQLLGQSAALDQVDDTFTGEKNPKNFGR